MDNEIFEKAMLTVKNRRNAAIAENERRIDEINKKIPQLREINDTIFNTGKELIRIISENREADIPAKIEQLKKYNTDIQSMSRQILIQYGYPPDYLDMHYTCPVCKDTGYSGTSYCECFKKLCGKLTADNLNKNTNLILSSFDTFSLSYYTDEAYDVMKRIFNYTQEYAYNFTEHSENILMTGGTGLGKTHLSLAIANEVLKKGCPVVYDSIINILRNIEKEHFSYEHSSAVIDSIMNAGLLIIDDLGTEYQTNFYSSTIYNILDSRINYNLPTIISTNLSYNEIKRRYEPRVASRLLTKYRLLSFMGKDVRLTIKKQQSKLSSQF